MYTEVSEENQNGENTETSHKTRQREQNHTVTVIVTEIQAFQLVLLGKMRNKGKSWNRNRVTSIPELPIS